MIRKINDLIHCQEMRNAPIRWISNDDDEVQSHNSSSGMPVLLREDDTSFAYQKKPITSNAFDVIDHVFFV